MEKTSDNPNLPWLVKHRHYSIEALRIFLGGLLFFKGYVFVENISEIYDVIEESMQISSFVVSHYVVVAHLIGGLMLAFGLLTRIAVVLQLPVLLGAVFFVHMRDIFMVTASELEYSILVLVLLIVFFFYGGGKLSMDHFMIRKKEKRQ